MRHGDATPLTAQGTILGTLQYMAPEQLEGRRRTRGRDIFAFGAVLYEMVTGRRAFEGKSQREPDGGDPRARPAAGVVTAEALPSATRSTSSGLVSPRIRTSVGRAQQIWCTN